jgi:ABC-type multidrug transport system fused ATPase/permease subunit
MKTRVKHPDGGERTAADTQADEDDQRERINQEREEGSRKHDRLPRWQREIPKFVLVFDFVLLLYFFAGITNVYWQSPLSMNLAFAIALAAMVTVLSYGFLAFTGHRWRSQKDDRGLPAFDEVDGLTKAASVAAMAVIGVLAVLMYLRMHTEVIDALGTQAAQTALVIPLAVAVVSAVANFLVVGIHAVDGSDEVHRMEKLAAATRRPSRRAHQLRQRAAQQAHR